MTTLPRSAGRNVGYDMLRTLACFMVVLLHASSQLWYMTPVTTSHWAAMHIWNTATRGAVPVFFMISGALFLNAPYPGRKLWTKNIPHLFVVYIVWSLFYGVDNMTIPGFLADPLGVFGQALAGRYHIWFLPAMIGIYLLMPTLYGVVHYAEGRALRPFLWVFGIFGILSGTVIGLDGILPAVLVQAARQITPALCSYCGYFLLGYVLSRIDPARLRRLPLIAVFFGTVALTALAGVLYSRHTGAAVALLHDRFSITSCVEAICLFLLLRTVKLSADSRAARVIRRLSGCTLGIYLLHPFVLDCLYKAGFHTDILHAAISVPIVTAAVAAISLAVVALIRLIPWAGKWLV